MDEEKILHVGAPNIGDRKLFDKLVDEIFDRRWFTNNGVVTQELEAKLAAYLGVKHCVTVCNATVGLQLASYALDVTGEVVMPAFTFVATPHAIQWGGLTPVFADIDPETHTVCPDSVESLITERTSAIVGVHVWGQHCHVNRLQEIANRHDLKVIFDAAHAFGCSVDGKMIGNFGDCEVFSFHATKFFNTFEGGAIATNNAALAEKVRLVRNFGFAGMDKVVRLGTNAKMPEVSAAMGLSVFAKLDEIIAHNKSNYLVYRDKLANLDGIRFICYDHLAHANWQYIVLEIDPDASGVSRDELFERLHQRNIRARRYFYPGCHLMEPYRSNSKIEKGQLDRTEKLCNEVLCLPTGTAVTSDDVLRVCSAIKEILSRS